MEPGEIQRLFWDRRTAVLCSHLPDGHIHAVAMWFVVEGSELVFTTKAKSQKVRNLRRDPRATVLVESGDTYSELRGVEMLGHVAIVDDPAEVRRGVALLADAYGAAASDLSLGERARNRVILRFSPERVTSWDHSKLHKD